MRGPRMDICLAQSSVRVARDASGSEGATTTTKDVMEEEMDLGGGDVRRTSLAKREC